MPADCSLEPQMAHVLFMDLVGYSRRSVDEQAEMRQYLQEVVRGTEPFRRAEEMGELIRLPGGDGLALVFLRTLIAPVQCALEIARALRSHPELQLRMGVHSGPVYPVQDINANQAVAGGGVNLAQRVMDCGDAGHILVSRTVAEVLGELRDWAPMLHDLGECEVKHGVRLHLFNLYTDELGNRELPAKLRSGSTSASSRVDPALCNASGTALRVALLYKRNAEPDQQVLKLLEAQLAGAGCQVFIDRHMTIGVEWAKEIERQVRSADAVVPLLSAASVNSEMLHYEVQIAHEAAQERGGKPRLLPVRIRYADPLPEPLAAFLNPIHYAIWQGPQDDERLTAELIGAVRKPPAPPEPLEPVGGAVPLDSRFYVERPTDEQFRAAIARRDSIVLVKGARQMGKTSLLARGLQQAREAGARVILTDFQMLNVAHLQSAEALYLTMAEWIADQLDLDLPTPMAGDARRSPNIHFQRYMRREVLGQIEGPIVWGLDEIDRLFTCDFANDVFGMIRSWHNARSLDPNSPWSRLTMAMAYATEAHLFITDLNQSPFNVGTRLMLADFTLEQVADLNERYGSPLRDKDERARFFHLVGGHPALVRRGLQEMATSGTDIAALEAQADRDEAIFGDHLRRLLVVLTRNPELCDVVRGVLQGRPCPTAESFYLLRSAGVMAGESAQDVHPRCQLYATYLKRHLL